MFARKVAVRLKPNSLTAFANLLEHDILPWLRKQEGFRDLVILALTDSSEVATISFWDHKQNAEAYSSTGYPEVLKILENLLDGKPYVKTFDVVASTCHGIALASQPDHDGSEEVRPEEARPEENRPIGEADPTESAYRPYETRL